MAPYTASRVSAPLYRHASLLDLSTSCRTAATVPRRKKHNRDARDGGLFKGHLEKYSLVSWDQFCRQNKNIFARKMGDITTLVKEFRDRV